MKLTDKIEITNEDNMQLMARYPDNYFKLAICDPEYGINASNMQMGSGKHKWKKGKHWDSKPPSDNYFTELFRVTENQIIWGGNYFNLTLNNNWIIWDKLNPNMSFSEAELAWCSIKRNIRIFKHYSAKVEVGGKIHPTQKPVELYKWLLHNYANEGDKILDTHLGSGSIAIACHDMNFELTACELDNDYYNDAIKRISNHIKQQKLF